MNNSIKGPFLASAVAALFLVTAGMAQESAASPSAGARAGTLKWVGANACKGKGACKSAQNDCKGQHGCKSKRFVKASSTSEGRHLGIVGGGLSEGALLGPRERRSAAIDCASPVNLARMEVNPPPPNEGQIAFHSPKAIKHDGMI
jgi:hypothetical protein